MKTTTLNEIRAHDPCREGWPKLLLSLNKTQADDEPITFRQILDSNGIKDAVWALRVLDYDDRCLFQADVAESVLYIFEDEYPDGKRPRLTIQDIRDYKAGKISKEKLKDAAIAARVIYVNSYAAAAAASYAADAASYAADAASYAAYAAADAASYAAYAAADAASYAAADAAAADADADADVARENKWQEIEQLFIKHFCED